ncbi:MAG: ribosome biogenesis GTPase YlqF [Clostridia bacterium]|nr:ribosome biogenesis GTPase YlqF [Clostridia bacterium]
MPEQIKQNIQWFPGHMAKTRRQIKELLPLTDAVTVLLDARVPKSSENPELDEIIGGKPRIYLLNKCDLADDNITSQWIEYYKREHHAALAADCRSGRGLNKYRALVRDVCREKIESNAEKGMAGRPVRVMVVGIPNTGKSSFINRMAGGSKAKVENRAGVTRSNQWFVVGEGLELLDTPGVLWPKFDDPAVGDKLAFTGGIKDSVLDPELLAMRLADVLYRLYPEKLEERYKITQQGEIEPYELLCMIGRKRGMLVGGGEVDTDRAANMLLNEFKAGKLGRISFEKPSEYV